MEELRTYWEVPAVAHFCSLFRAVFKLIDFDIEDFEEALIVDTESAVEGGRSSLIVDVLTALLRGCLGRRDVTLLNYNQFLHDLLSLRWVRGGLGDTNPLGVDRERACFHILPLYAKVKILHSLCEWRLERPDVETLTKDLSGDSLRVVPLGLDQKGATYWYFYGTRLYKEEPVVEPKSKKTRSESPKKSPTKSGLGRGRRKRRKRNYDFGAKKSKSPTKKQKQQKEKEENEQEEEGSRSQSVDSSGSNSKTASSPKKRSKLNEEEESTMIADESPQKQAQRRWKPKLEPELETASTSGQNSSSFPATPAQATNPNLTSIQQNDDSQTTSSFKDLIRRMYSRDAEEEEDDDEDEESIETKEEGGIDRKLAAKNRKDEVDQKKKSMVDFQSIEEKESMALEDRSAVEGLLNDDRGQDDLDQNEQSIADQQQSQSIIADDDHKSIIDGDQKMDIDQVPTSITNHGNHIDLKRPYIPEGPPPWDQPGLLPTDQSIRGWTLVCASLDEWQQIVDSLARPKGKPETELYEVLSRDFLPAMQDLFDQKEKERVLKLAELSRRTSDRLEVKRMQKEREEQILADREKVELDRLAKIDDERTRRIEQEKREQRVRLRELEREKRNLIKERAREERSRRLEWRQKRQQLIAEGKSIPDDLLNATGGASSTNEQELNELDIEIELEHMYGQLEKLLDQLKENEDGEPFMEAVSVDLAPDYYQVIETPMDFTKIEDKLLFREYKNKGEFVEDFNRILLNCLQYNGLQSEYTKTAQRLERTFIKAWKKFFPPADLEDSGEDARQEELHCIGLLGALDKKIKEDVAAVQKADADAKAQTFADKKEAQRLRKREADRRRRKLQSEARQAVRDADQARLSANSLSSLNSPSIISTTNDEDGTPRRQSLPAPFLVGRTNLHRTSVRAPGITTSIRGGSAGNSNGRLIPALRGVDGQPGSGGNGGGLTTYMPGVSSVTRLRQPFTPTTIQQSSGTPTTSRRLLIGPQPSRLLPSMVVSTTSGGSGNQHQMAPITVHSQGQSMATRVIKVSETGSMSMAPQPTYLLSDGTTRLVRLVTTQDQHQPGGDVTRPSTAGIAVSNRPILPAIRAPQSMIRTSTPIQPSRTPAIHSYATNHHHQATAGTSTGGATSGQQPNVVTLSSKNVVVSIKDKQAYFTKKDETTGEMRTVGPIDKETLVRKLAIFQQQGGDRDQQQQQQLTSGQSTSISTSGQGVMAAKPVCSVAPVRQPPQQSMVQQQQQAQIVLTTGRAPGPGPGPATHQQQTVLVSSGNQQFVLVPTGGQQAQVITIAGGGSYILTSTNQQSTSNQSIGGQQSISSGQSSASSSGATPIYLATTSGGGGESNSNQSTSGVQLIQVMPQIILNSQQSQQQQQRVQLEGESMVTKETSETQ